MKVPEHISNTPSAVTTARENGFPYSKENALAHFVMLAGQAFLLTGSGSGAALVNLQAAAIAMYKPLLVPVAFAPICFPIALVVSNLPEKSKQVSWLIPAIGITLATLSGRVVYDYALDPLAKFVAYSVHSCVVTFFSVFRLSDDEEVMSLTCVVEKWLGVSSKLSKLSVESKNRVYTRSEAFSAIVTVTAGLGLTFFAGMHVITANVIAHVAAATTRAVSARVFVSLEQEKQSVTV